METFCRVPVPWPSTRRGMAWRRAVELEMWRVVVRDRTLMEGPRRQRLENCLPKGTTRYAILMVRQQQEGEEIQMGYWSSCQEQSGDTRLYVS